MLINDIISDISKRNYSKANAERDLKLLIIYRLFPYYNLQCEIDIIKKSWISLNIFNNGSKEYMKRAAHVKNAFGLHQTKKALVIHTGPGQRSTFLARFWIQKTIVHFEVVK